MILPYWHRNPGSLRVVRTSRRPFQTVLHGFRRSNQAFTLLAPESWKSASGLVVSQTDAFDSGGSCESKYMLKLIGTGILEVCEWSDSVSDRRFRLGEGLGGRNLGLESHKRVTKAFAGRIKSQHAENFLVRLFYVPDT